MVGRDNKKPLLAIEYVRVHVRAQKKQNRGRVNNLTRDEVKCFPEIILAVVPDGAITVHKHQKKPCPHKLLVFSPLAFFST